ncbi:MAG: alkaline phosphatase family protein [Peptococcaceae bacterium]
MTIRNKAYTDKLFVLGIDGLEPRYSRKMLREGKMPNLQKFIDRGAAREDLMMLGGHPTVTPPNVDHSSYRCLCKRSWYYRLLPPR